MKYRVILADPPWSFATYSDKGKGKSAEQHYSTMSLDDICSLPVKEWVEDDAALFIWATWPTIFQTERVINSWGFKYSGLAWEWIKKNPVTGKFAFGCGYGTRKNCEPLLLARRGKPFLKSRSERDFMFSPRREHSRKPDETYSRIERMFDGPFLELFARQEREGWTAWGNQTNRFTIQNTIPSLAGSFV